MSANTPDDSGSRSGWHEWTIQTFSGWRFPVFALSLIVAYELLVVAMLLLPISDDALGRFAEEFKTWCFGYDPATGKSQPMYLVLMLTEPLVLGLVLAAVYGKQIKGILATPRRIVPYFGTALVVVLASIGVLLSSSDGAAAPHGELPFPAERIRTSYSPPRFDLVDHEGQPVSLGALSGQVVVLTGVYASCGFTCPMILKQAKRAVAALTPEERASVTLLGVTLDPQHDTPEVLAKMASGQGVAAPTFRLATGAPTVIEPLLDRLGIERRRDPETGVIDHSNLFLVVDRQGRIAYRLTLGERQEQWLITALQQLVAEKTPIN
jgi:protein SCO1/2